MKKILLLLGISSITVAYADQDCKVNHNSISYSTQAQTTIKSDSILVKITGYATTTLEDQNSVEKNITKTINDIVKAKWEVKNLEQTTNNSGTLNISVQLQARISKTELAKLQSQIQKQKSHTQKFEVKVLDYNAPVSDTEKAKQKLMIEIYNNTKEYVKNFNDRTDSHYAIQSINYNDASSYGAHSNKVMLMRTSGNTTNDNLSSTNISQDIKMNANVKFVGDSYGD